MKIEILGTGCAKCNALQSRTREVADRLGISYELEKITSVAEIAKRGALLTPGLAVDGRLKISGRLPSEKEITRLLTWCSKQTNED